MVKDLELLGLLALDVASCMRCFLFPFVSEHCYFAALQSVLGCNQASASFLFYSSSIYFFFSQGALVLFLHIKQVHF